MPVLELCNIIKHFGAIHALNGVDLSLDASEVIGLMGAKKVDGIAVAAGMANALRQGGRHSRHPARRLPQCRGEAQGRGRFGQEGWQSRPEGPDLQGPLSLYAQDR